MTEFRDERSENGRAKNHASQQLAEDGGLPEAAHPLPKHAANEEQEDQLGGKNCRGVLRRQGPSPFNVSRDCCFAARSCLDTGSLQVLIQHIAGPLLWIKQREGQEVCLSAVAWQMAMYDDVKLLLGVSSTPNQVVTMPWKGRTVPSRTQHHDRSSYAFMASCSSIIRLVAR
jgi:hypothetical protein